MQVMRRRNISEQEVTTVTADCGNDSVTDSLSRPVYVGINYHGKQTLDNTILANTTTQTIPTFHNVTCMSKTTTHPSSFISEGRIGLSGLARAAEPS